MRDYIYINFQKKDKSIKDQKIIDLEKNIFEYENIFQNQSEQINMLKNENDHS